MKKIIAISLLTVSLAATSAFGQGWLQLNSVRSQVWDNFTTPGTAAISSHVDVALFWAAGANVANPMSLANTPVSGYTIHATDWNNLLTSSFTLAQDASSGKDVILTTTTRGAVVYAPLAAAVLPVQAGILLAPLQAVRSLSWKLLGTQLMPHRLPLLLQMRLWAGLI